MLTLAERIVAKYEVTKPKTYKQYNRQIALAIIAYAKDYLKINNARISLSAMPKNVRAAGDVVLVSGGNNDAKFAIRAPLESTVGYMVQFIVHELVHVKQIMRHELSLESTGIMWKGKLAISISDYAKIKWDDYIKLPFEAEAISISKEHSDKFLNSPYADKLRATSPTLAFILDS